MCIDICVPLSIEILFCWMSYKIIGAFFSFLERSIFFVFERNASCIPLEQQQLRLDLLRPTMKGFRPKEIQLRPRSLGRLFGV